MANGQGVAKHKGSYRGIYCGQPEPQVKELLGNWKKLHKWLSQVFQGTFPTSRSFWKGPVLGNKKSTGSQMGSISTGVHRRQDTQGRGVVEGRFSDSPGIAQQVHRNETDEDWDRRTRNRHRHGTAQPAQGLGTSKGMMGRAQVKLLPASSHTHLTCFPAAWFQIPLHQCRVCLEHRQPQPKKDKFEVQASNTVKMEKCEQMFAVKKHVLFPYTTRCHEDMRYRYAKRELVEGRSWM